MILIALAIVFGGLGALSLSKSDSSANSAPAATPSVAAGTANPNSPKAATTPTATAAATSAAPKSSGSAAASGTVDKSIPVRVYNNSTITGLASKTASTLESDGWKIAETGNYSEGDIPKTTVYYGDSASEEAAAKAIASQIGATAEPRFAGIKRSAPGVIIIVTGS